MATRPSKQKAPFCRQCGAECELRAEPENSFDIKTGKRDMAHRWVCPRQPCAHIHGCNMVRVIKKFLWFIPLQTEVCSRCGRYSFLPHWEIME